MDIPKNGTGPGGGNGNSPTDDFFRLLNVVTAYNLAHPTSPLPIPDIETGYQVIDDPSVPSPLLSPWTYAVLHYGVGNGGNQSSGGGEEIFFLNGATGFNFPENGTGPNGFGGFSGGVLYQATTSTPEASGLLGGLTALGLAAFSMRHRFVGTKMS